MTTYTTDLRFPIMTPGDPSVTNSWGTILNSFIQVLETAITGSSGINIAGLTQYTLTVANNAPDQARQSVYNFTGALTAACTVTIPQVPKTGFVWNQTTGGQDVILTTGATGGENLSVPPGYMMIFVCDGTNVVGPQFSAARLPGEMVAYAGNTLPPLWHICDGTAISRTTYAALFNAITQANTGTTTAGSTSMSVTSGSGIQTLPCPISGPGIPAGTIVTAESGSAGAWTWTLSAAATASLSGASFVTAPYGVGDGLTTFNKPDLRSRAPVGQDNMGAAGPANLSPVTSLGAQVGSQYLQAHIHSINDPGHSHGAGDHGHSHGVNDPGHSHPQSGNTLSITVSSQTHGAGESQIYGPYSDYTYTGYTSISIQTGYADVFVNAAYTGITVNSTGSGGAQNMQPSLGVNWIIYAGA